MRNILTASRSDFHPISKERCTPLLFVMDFFYSCITPGKHSTTQALTVPNERIRRQTGMIIDKATTAWYAVERDGGIFMSKKYLVQTTRSIILLLAVLGLAFFGAAVPVGGSQLLENAPELGYCYLPWIVFIEMMVVPCYAVLVRTWEIITSLLYDRMFTAANARNFQRISIITFTTTVYFFFGNTALFFLNMSHPLIYLISFAFIGIGVGVALAAAILSYRAGQISNIQEQSKLSEEANSADT